MSTKFHHLAMDSSPYGNRTRITRLRVSRPAVRRTGHCQCAGQELNLHIPKAGGLQPLELANAQPTHVVFQVAREGVEPTSTKV